MLQFAFKLQCKDPDEITPKTEICAALKEQFKLVELTEEFITNLRKAYGGIQAAKIRLPMEAAQKFRPNKFGVIISRHFAKV